MKQAGDAELAKKLAKLWPHREHEAGAVCAWFCRMGLHRWRSLHLAELAPGRDVRFCFWCSKVRIDGAVYHA